MGLQPKYRLSVNEPFHGKLVKVSDYRVMSIAGFWRVMFICGDGSPYISCDEFDTAFDAGCYAAQGKLHGFRVA